MSEIIITKRCSKCKQTKPVSEFQKNRANNVGYQSQCKICRKTYQQNKEVKKHTLEYFLKYRKTERGKEVERKYRQSEKGKIANRKSSKKFSRTEKSKQARKIYFTKYPERRQAVNAVNNAITAGKLPQPDSLQCHYCPKQAKQYHHWRGYAKKHWFDVIPICINCHSSLKK